MPTTIADADSELLGTSISSSASELTLTSPSGVGQVEAGSSTRDINEQHLRLVYIVTHWLSN